MPTWTTPADWEINQLVTADDLNEQLRDNLEYLLEPNYDQIIRDNSGDYSTTSATFEDVDETNLALSLTTHGGHILVQVIGSLATAGEAVFLDLDLDGTRAGDGFTNGLYTHEASGDGDGFFFAHIFPTPSAGAHTIKLQWRRESGNSNAMQSNSTESPVVMTAVEL